MAAVFTQPRPIPVRMETFIPWKLVKRGVRRKIITPMDAPQEFTDEAAQERDIRTAAQDSALVRALGLAHHWQRLLDEGRFSSMTEIAQAEGLNSGRVSTIGVSLLVVLRRRHAAYQGHCHFHSPIIDANERELALTARRFACQSSTTAPSS